MEVPQYVQCQICKQYYKSITQSHLKTHGIDLERYQTLFPDAQVITPYIRHMTANFGSKHPNWKGGISPNFYRDYILHRDDNRCQWCGSDKKLCVITIDFRLEPTKKNMITICRSCANKYRSRKNYVNMRNKFSSLAKEKERIRLASSVKYKRKIRK